MYFCVYSNQNRGGDKRKFFYMKHFSCLLFLLLLLFQAWNQPEPSPYPEITFQKMAAHPEGGRSTAVSFVINDTAYMALGRLRLFDLAVNDCWAYYPESNSWARKADFPGLPRVNAVAEVVNGKAFAGLGYQPLDNVYINEAYLRDWWMYDAEKNTWERKADYPGEQTITPFTSGAVSFVYGNDIYVGAGFNSYSFSNRFWKYNTLTDAWTQINDFTSTSRAIATALNADGRIFFGTGYHTYNLNDWWEYLPSDDSWKKRREMPDGGRVNALSFAVGKRVFVATGRHFGGTETNGKLFPDIMEYDADKDVWYYRGQLETGRENAIAFVLKGRVYIGMGENDSTVINDLWSFEP